MKYVSLPLLLRYFLILGWEREAGLAEAFPLSLSQEGKEGGGDFLSPLSYHIISKLEGGRGKILHNSFLTAVPAQNRLTYLSVLHLPATARTGTPGSGDGSGIVPFLYHSNTIILVVVVLFLFTALPPCFPSISDLFLLYRCLLPYIDFYFFQVEMVRRWWSRRELCHHCFLPACQNSSCCTYNLSACLSSAACLGVGGGGGHGAGGVLFPSLPACPEHCHLFHHTIGWEACLPYLPMPSPTCLLYLFTPFFPDWDF